MKTIFSIFALKTLTISHPERICVNGFCDFWNCNTGNARENTSNRNCFKMSNEFSILSVCLNILRVRNLANFAGLLQIRHFLVIVIMISCIDVYAQQSQNDIRRDSVIFYIDRSFAGKEIDTTLLIRADNLLSSQPFDSVMARRLMKAAEGLKARKKMAFFYFFQKFILNYFQLTGKSTDKQAFIYSIIDHYNETKEVLERPAFLTALLDAEGDVVYFTNSLHRYLSRNDSDAVSLSYFRLAAIYHRKGLYDLEIYNLKKSRSYLNRNEITQDGTITGLYGWTNHTGLMGSLSNDIGDYEGAISLSIDARDARINGLKDSSNVAYTSCNITYARLMMGQTDSVKELLECAEALSDRYHDHPALARCYEMKGFYYLKTDQLDSAEHYLAKCRELVDGFPYRPWSPAGMHLVNYYLAQVRVRQGRLKEAKLLLEKEIPLLEKRRMEQLKEYKLLIKVSLELGDAAGVRDVFNQYTEIQDELRDDTRKNRVTSFETEQKIAGAENIISDLEAQQKISQLTRNFLTGFALLLILVVFVIFNRFMVTRKQKVIIETEKKRSEELLLNILPEEVAAELKLNGSAQAVQMDQVTVLFTDFKGFTSMSEILSPQELVRELNECFSVFDSITEKYGIEKIKTIGDAYMAAGGLPTSNETHAIDVIHAAFEMRDFIEQAKARKFAAGLPFFEIRIGIHTGPVVAGIVGVKKFSYDIWGDTVNTASRMESSGEVGKVNISQTTYEILKDKPGFVFESRGQIVAKGKGEIEMYFVSKV
ncbi:MAG: hypothetical protein JNJ58_14540 [Chitinophagaceae bacterium]|nr:hypothetical protein [Chitinophagaceae bacterium]